MRRGRAVGASLVVAAVLLGVAAPVLAAHHRAPRKAGGIALGTWGVQLGTTVTGARSSLSFRLTKEGSGAFAGALLKRLTYTGSCIFAPSEGNPTPSNITVTWTYKAFNSIGPIVFTRSRPPATGFDLDENDPGPMALSHVKFLSATKMRGMVAASTRPPADADSCFTGTGAAAELVPFVAHWQRA